MTEPDTTPQPAPESAGASVQPAAVAASLDTLSDEDIQTLVEQQLVRAQHNPDGARQVLYDLYTLLNDSRAREERLEAERNRIADDRDATERRNEELQADVTANNEHIARLTAAKLELERRLKQAGGEIDTWRLLHDHYEGAAQVLSQLVGLGVPVNRFYLDATGEQVRAVYMLEGGATEIIHQRLPDADNRIVVMVDAASVLEVAVKLEMPGRPDRGTLDKRTGRQLRAFFTGDEDAAGSSASMYNHSN